MRRLHIPCREPTPRHRRVLAMRRLHIPRREPAPATGASRHEKAAQLKESSPWSPKREKRPRSNKTQHSQK